MWHVAKQHCDPSPPSPLPVRRAAAAAPQCFWMYGFFWLLNRMGILRVSMTEEAIGLDAAAMGDADAVRPHEAKVGGSPDDLRRRHVPVVRSGGLAGGAGIGSRAAETKPRCRCPVQIGGGVMPRFGGGGGGITAPFAGWFRNSAGGTLNGSLKMLTPDIDLSTLEKVRRAQPVPHAASGAFMQQWAATTHTNWRACRRSTSLSSLSRRPHARNMLAAPCTGCPPPPVARCTAGPAPAASRALSPLHLQQPTLQQDQGPHRRPPRP